MNRYLLNFSYIGTKFRGIQKQVVKSEDIKADIHTVQDCIEFALKKIPSTNELKLVLSSRTDKGVHALSNYAHFDLITENQKLFPAKNITKILNKTFLTKGITIRILDTIHVPQTFHCRFNAKLRTYLYRIAVSRNINSSEQLQNNNYLNYIPIEDISRCLYIPKIVDINALIENSKLFKGRHDFRTFMTTTNTNLKQQKPTFSVRIITDISVNRCLPPINSYECAKAIENYDYWEIKISGVSFLHKQIRRIIGSLLAVSLGKLSQKDIYEMITIPSKYSWNSKAVVVPPHGLYLCDVHYNKKDFLFHSNVNALRSYDQNESLRTNFEEKERAASN